MTLEAGLSALLDEEVYLEARVGETDPTRIDVDVYGNTIDHWLPIANPDPCNPDDVNAWPAGIEETFQSLAADTTDRDVRSVTALVWLDPSAPMTATMRIRRLSTGEILHPIIINRYAGGGGSHVEVRASIVR